MNFSADAAARLDELEAHVAHQDGTIQDLSDIALQQWDAIKHLGKQIERLTDQVQALENEIASGPSGEEPPPPHY